MGTDTMTSEQSQRGSLSDEDLILGPWNATDRGFPDSLRVDDLFGQQAARTPDAVAVSFEGQSLTYAQLAVRVDDLAQKIESSCIEPGTVIGIYMQRSLEMLIAALGVMRAKCCYLPLDPSFPSHRLDFMLEDSGAPLVLTQIQMLKDVPKVVPHVLVVDATAPIQRAMSRDPSDACSAFRAPGCELQSYVIYTSGSTGKPKGVQISHRAAVNFLWHMKAVFDLQPTDTVLAVTTFSFDIAVLELYLPLICGAKVAIVNEQIAADGLALRAKIREVGATMVQTTPSRWRLIAGAGLDRSDGISHALCGGEAFPLDLAAKIGPHVGSLWNMYGPTEATVWCSMSKVEPDAEAITIGRPFGNTKMYVLGEDDRLAPIGVAGELHIGGEQLATGYIGRPVLTEERFRWLDDFYGTRVRLYRTGDLCRMHRDGQIEYLSRIDQQVKLRGYRIELGDIEANINTHEAVNASAVTVQKGPDGADMLVAFIELKGDHEDSARLGFAPGSMRAFLSAALPKYMIPSHFVVLGALPQTPNGKVDRKALPLLNISRLEFDDIYEEPRTETEARLAEIWADALGVRRVGVRDDFTELGGHSLAMVAIATMIRDRLGHVLPIRVLGAANTVEGMAEIVLSHGEDRGDELAEPPKLHEIVFPLPERRVLARTVAAMVGVAVVALVAVRLSSLPMQARLIEEDLFHSHYAATEVAHEQLLAETGPHAVFLGSSSGVFGVSPTVFERSFARHGGRTGRAAAADSPGLRAYNLSLMGSTAFVGHIYARTLRELYQGARNRPSLAIVEFAPQNATSDGFAHLHESGGQIAHFATPQTICAAAALAPREADNILYRYLMGAVAPSQVTSSALSGLWQRPSFWPSSDADEDPVDQPADPENGQLLLLQFARLFEERISLGSWHPAARHRLPEGYFQGGWVEPAWRSFADADTASAAARDQAINHYNVPEMRLLDDQVGHVVAQVRQMQAVADRVVIVLYPIHPVARLSIAGEKRLQRSLETIRHQTNVDIIDLFEAHSFEEDDFYDFDHLLPGPATELSETLGQRVAELMDGSSRHLARADLPPQGGGQSFDPSGI